MVASIRRAPRQKGFAALAARELARSLEWCGFPAHAPLHRSIALAHLSNADVDVNLSIDVAAEDEKVSIWAARDGVLQRGQQGMMASFRQRKPSCRCGIYSSMCQCQWALCPVAQSLDVFVDQCIDLPPHF